LKTILSRKLKLPRDNLRQLGWTVGAGGNIQVDYRWPGNDIERIRLP
jgi:hypothetical protein